MESHKYISYLIDYNTAEFFLELGRLNKDEVSDTSQIKFIFSKNWQSRIFMANFNESNPSCEIKKLISRMKDLKISILWFVSPYSYPKNLNNLLENYGFILENKWKAMAIDIKKMPYIFDIPEGMQIKKISDLEELKKWSHILVESFQFSKVIDSYKKYFINAGLDDINFDYYLGFFNGKPVATSIFFKGQGAAGIFYIGTVEEARGHGIAQAMVYYILNKSKIHGYRFCVLQASEMGYTLYKKIGFKEYHTTNIYRYKNPI